MRFTSFIGAVSLGAGLAAMAPATQAAMVTFSTPQYRVDYDDSSDFGLIAANGSGSDGVTQTISFSWAAPFTGPAGHDPVIIASGTSNSFTVPMFFLTAASGYVFQDLTITLEGVVFGPASAGGPGWMTSALLPTYSGPSGPAGTWTLAGKQFQSIPFTDFAFFGGLLGLNSSGGTIFATQGPEVRFKVVAVPEPQSVALALAGVGVALLAMRRRHRA